MRVLTFSLSNIVELDKESSDAKGEIRNLWKMSSEWRTRGPHGGVSGCETLGDEWPSFITTANVKQQRVTNGETTSGT